MRKTSIYIVLLAILAYGVYFFLFTGKENNFSVDEAGFTVKDTAAIGRIFIDAPGGKSVLVERTDSGWVLNKKYKALKSTVNNLLKALAQQAALYPVPHSLHNTVVSAMAGNSIKVEIDNKKAEKMRVFYVGGETKDFSGTYMLMEGAKQPYIVNIQGFQGYLAPFYAYTVGDWRDRTLFNLGPEQIKSISVQYPEHPLNSFVLKHDDDKIIIEAHPDIMHIGALNQHRASTYLKFFENVNCEGYISSDNTMDSLLKIMPKHCDIDLTGKQGQHQHVDIYWMPLNRRSKNTASPSMEVPDNQYDADRFFAVTNGYKDTVMIQAFVFNKIFRKSYEFYQPDPINPIQIIPKGIKNNIVKPDDK